VAGEIYTAPVWQASVSVKELSDSEKNGGGGDVDHMREFYNIKKGYILCSLIY